jgi:hypothetical protein
MPKASSSLYAALASRAAFLARQASISLRIASISSTTSSSFPGFTFRR